MTLLVAGAGRMGRGIAQSYALAGQSCVLVDLKPRSADATEALRTAVFDEIGNDLAFAVDVGLLKPDQVAVVLGRVSLVGAAQATSVAAGAELVYEGVPEVLEVKRAALEWISRHVPADAVVASTTSTLNVDELAAMVVRPERFLNAHWLNPAHLMPLVEVAVGKATSEAAFSRVKASLEAVGKVPVRCNASPGYIVPRIQALAMNEAARLVEEGVASAEDVDRAVRVGFGLRFAVLGLLEFIDWGGNDILYNASGYLGKTVDEARYRVPAIVEENMRAGRNGLREGQGFYDYDAMDTDAYRRQRLGEFVGLIRHLGLLPKGLGGAGEEQ